MSLSQEPKADQGRSQSSADGARAATAEFLVSNKDLIKARFRAQLQLEPGSMNDSSDFFASLLRRMDGRLASGVVDGEIVEVLHQLYLETMMDYARANGDAEHSTADAEHQIRRDSVTVSDNQQTGKAFGLENICEDVSDEDEQIIRLRAAGLSHKATAQVLGLSASAVRQRWSRLMRSRSKATRKLAS